MQFDITLNEICKISALKATTALSKFIHSPVGVLMRPVEVKQWEEITSTDENDEKTLNIFVPITGNLPGASFFVYSKKAALALCDLMFDRKKGSTKTFSDPEKSALSEVANIVMGNFLSSFAQSLQMDYLMQRSAVFDCGPLNIPISDQLTGASNAPEESVIKISFGFENVNMEGYVLIVFDEGKIKAILKNLSPQYKQ